MLELKKYIGTKVIMAAPMTRGEYNYYRGWEMNEDENPDDEGYLVKYSDNYESWSPKGVFDSAYRCFDVGMSFGSAIDLLKMGYKLTRKDWGTNERFIYYVPASSYYPGSSVGEELVTDDGKVTYDEYISMRTEQGTIIPWLANQADILSNDWIVV